MDDYTSFYAEAATWHQRTTTAAPQGDTAVAAAGGDPSPTPVTWFAGPAPPPLLRGEWSGTRFMGDKDLKNEIHRPRRPRPSRPAGNRYPNPPMLPRVRDTAVVIGLRGPPRARNAPRSGWSAQHSWGEKDERKYKTARLTVVLSCPWVGRRSMEPVELVMPVALAVAVA